MDSTKLKILHLDDDAVFLDFFTISYRKLLDITSVNNGEEALSKIRTEKFDAIVTDFDMPEMDGMQFLRTVKKEFPFMPVIFYTNQGNEQTAREIFLAGASDYFTKDFFEFAHKEKLINSLKNAHEKRLMEEAIRKHQDELEELVKLRTGQLEKANSELEIELAERTIAEKDKELTIRILELINNPVNIDKVIFKIIKYLKEYTGYEAIAIRLKEGNHFPYFTYDGFSNEFIKLENCICVTELNAKDKKNQQRAADLSCICGAIIKGKIDTDKTFFTKMGSFWTNDMTRLLKFHKDYFEELGNRNICTRFGYKSIALIPLRSRNESIGLLQINDSRKDLFSEDRIKFLEGLALTIGISVNRKQTEEALRKSEEFNKSIIRSSPDCIKVLDWNGNLKFMSHSGQEMLGITDFSKFFNISLSDFWEGEKKKEVIEALENARNGDRGHFTGFHPTLDGRPKWWDVTIVPIRGAEGEEGQLLAVSRDITEQKGNLEEINKFKTLADNANYGVALADLKGNLIYVNKYFAEVHGYNIDELTGKNLSIFHNESQMETVINLKSKIITEGGFSNETVWHVHKDGTEFPMIMNSSTILAEDGTPLFMSATAIKI